MGNAILRGQTGGASPTVISQKKLTLLADVTIYSARTSVDFTGLNVGTDTELLLVSDIYNPVAGLSECYLFVNGNGTTTNYRSQTLQVGGTTLNPYRYSSPIFGLNNYTRYISTLQTIKITNNNYFTSQANSNQYNGTGSLEIGSYFLTSTFTITNITSLTVSTSVTNSIGVGSRFQLYSLNTGGEKTWVTS